MRKKEEKMKIKRVLAASRYDTIRYDTGCYFNVRSKADMSQLNLPHGTNNEKWKTEKLKIKTKLFSR